MTDYFQPLEEGCFYHIYNRGNNGDLLFYEERNYDYFLEQFQTHLFPYVKLYAYCLLPNHFHMLIRVADFKTLAPEDQVLSCGRSILTDPSAIVSEKFRCFFINYSMAIKKQEGRTGSLFEKNFKRKRINANRYFTTLINYIHRNPETHGLLTDFVMYPYSSYHDILSDGAGIVEKDEVLEWFGGKNRFIDLHRSNPVIKRPKRILIE